jgi:hypothetical protein
VPARPDKYPKRQGIFEIWGGLAADGGLLGRPRKGKIWGKAPLCAGKCGKKE